MNTNKPAVTTRFTDQENRGDVSTCYEIILVNLYFMQDASIEKTTASTKKNQPIVLVDIVTFGGCSRLRAATETYTNLCGLISKRR